MFFLPCFFHNLPTFLHDVPAAAEDEDFVPAVFDFGGEVFDVFEASGDREVFVACYVVEAVNVSVLAVEDVLPFFGGFAAEGDVLAASCEYEICDVSDEGGLCHVVCDDDDGMT